MPQYDPKTRLYRSSQLAVFAVSMTWVVAANALATRAARGLSVRFGMSDEFLLLNGLFFLFLLILGFIVLEGVARRHTPPRQTLGLPRRPTARAEWATGAALGWGMILVSVLAMSLARALHVRFWFEPRAFWLAALNLATVALFSLASEMAFRGYPYRRLIEVVGQGWATAIGSVLYGLLATSNQDSTYLSTVVAILFGLVMCLTWQRTHGLWVGWGMHFGWAASLGVLFGLPVEGFDNLSSLVQTRAIGSKWLTGGVLGPEGTLLMPMLLFFAVLVLYRVTGDWAWNYTHSPIVAGGYPMDVAPPPAHAAMEEKLASAPTLVQILPSTPQARSAESESR